MLHWRDIRNTGQPDRAESPYWRLAIPGFEECSAQWIKAFFAAHPALTERPEPPNTNETSRVQGGEANHPDPPP
ncbi:hypothetical protein, partial [Burkholderia ambifaria]|uniref:hypothetical protein n=1 Tax=Burkholderia ambifaria TaxID=152480 RepID=UPI001E5FDA65